MSVPRAPRQGAAVMTADSLVALTIALLLLAYLVYAMLRPEKF